MIVIDGRLENRDWNDKDGNKRTSTEIIVENAYFGDSKKDGDGAPANGGNSYGGNGGYNAPANNYGGAPNYGGNNYGGAPNYGGNTYAAPAGGPASDFAMLDDDDAQLPF
jgi:single-strand DNA-binding protein